MNVKWCIVAGGLLDRAADRFANHGCNDWKWPKSWSRDDRLKLAIAMVCENVSRTPEQLTPDDREDVERMVSGEHGPPDWWVMRFLARQLIAEGFK